MCPPTIRGSRSGCPDDGFAASRLVTRQPNGRGRATEIAHASWNPFFPAPHARHPAIHAVDVIGPTAGIPPGNLPAVRRVYSSFLKRQVVSQLIERVGVC